MKAESLVDRLAATLSETDVKTKGETLENIKSAQLTHTLTGTVKRTRTRRLSEKMTKKKAKNF